MCGTGGFQLDSVLKIEPSQPELITMCFITEKL